MDNRYEQEKSTLLELPILKHFDESKGEIALNANTLKKGEKGLFWALSLALMGVGGYLIWKYIIPPLFTMLGQVIALSATAVFLIFLVMMFPVIMKGLRFATKNLHKALIQSNPFNELEEQKNKMMKTLRREFEECLAPRTAERQLNESLVTPDADAALSTSMTRSWVVIGSGRRITGSLSPNLAIVSLSQFLSSGSSRLCGES
jgi:hypothetical protein